MQVLLLFIAVFMRFVSIWRRNRFQRKLQLLAVRSRRRRTEAAYCFHSQKQIYRGGKSRRFWKGRNTGSSIWSASWIIKRIHLSFLRFSPFCFGQKCHGKHKIDACFISHLTSLSNQLRKLLLIGGTKLPTRLSYLDWWLKFNENSIEVCRLA